MRLGRFDLTVVSDGEFRLDGGAMFGVVPKSLWSRVKASDEQNRIRMGTNCLLVAAGRELVLIDTGIGDKLDAKSREMYGCDPQAVPLPEQIRAAGYELGDVTHVLLTHLHFDHCGWNTRRAGERVVPTFPNARYWLCRGEVEHAREPNERDRVSYLPENWEPLFEAGVVELFEERGSPIRGVEAIKAPGHNRDHCIVVIDGGCESETTIEVEGSQSARAVHLADLVPTFAHAPLPWIMGFDAFPMETLASKKLWVPRIAAEGWLCIFEHDPEVPVGRIVEERPGRFRALEIRGQFTQFPLSRAAIGRGQPGIE